MGDLYKKLTEYDKSDVYPYHMPGHKRRLSGPTLQQIKEIDITEIDGFDNLHDAGGILKDIQQKAADLYGASDSFFLINGSTCGLLTAISAVTSKGGSILMARNCHRAAYHGAYLRDLDVHYIWPNQNKELSISMEVTADQVRQGLVEYKDVQAVLIVSPTYEGYVSDIKAIASLVHEYGIPLIVDEAHGAHLGFHEGWNDNSVRLGADIVIHSLHKTLPAPTQTALLHVNGTLVNRDLIRKFLHIYETSSPSYIFMSAMEDTLDLLKEDERKLFQNFFNRYNNLQRMLDCLDFIHYVKEPNLDIGKMVIFDSSHTFSGKQLYDKLLEEYHLQMEMAAGRYVLAMFTIADEDEAYQRVTMALFEIEKQIDQLKKASSKPDQCEYLLSDSKNETEDFVEYAQIAEFRPLRKYTISQAWDARKITIPLQDAVLKVAGEFVNFYPPGIPYLVPGEVITKEHIRCLQEYVKNGYNIQGVDICDEILTIKIVDDVCNV